MRLTRSLANGPEIPKKATITRSKLNIQKWKHFLDFLLNHKLLQDVAYGVTNLKFDNDYCQKIAHTISFYLEACKNSDYNPLSESSLWRILTSIKPSKRKRLGGFDNLTASGKNEFEILLKLASKYRIEKIND